MQTLPKTVSQVLTPLDEEDVEKGLLPKQSGPTKQQRSSKSPIPLPKKVQREVLYYIRKAKENASPVAEKMQTTLGELWTRYMDGRTKSEKIIIGIIAVSVFILFVLLIAVVAKK